MKIENVKLSDIKLNPNNPRLIKDDKFKKLVQSIIDFPEMLKIRPIVVNEDMIILGGNMRFKACKELKHKEVSIIKLSGLSAEKQREFLIKDNVSGGEWDWNLLANEWDEIELGDWGLDIPNWSKGIDANNMSEDDIDTDENFDPIGTSKGLHKIIFIFDNEDEAIKWYGDNNIKSDYKKFGGSDVSVWHVNLSTKYAK